MKKRIFLLVAGCTFLLPFPAQAVETNITVRVLAHDAKFIGSGMGKIQALLKDAQTGELLNAGLIEGATGDTEVLMNTPQGRDTLLSRGGAAKWVGQIDIQDPTRVELEISGPLAAGTGMQTASRTFWVLPGQDIEGDGIVMELYGFVVQPISPGPHQKFRLSDEIPVEAHVVMMCGCPVGPNELWDSRTFEIAAQVRKGDETVAEFPLRFTGQTSRFAGSFTPHEAGSYEIILTAADPRRNNFGVGLTTFVVR